MKSKLLVLPLIILVFACDKAEEPVQTTSLDGMAFFELLEPDGLSSKRYQRPDPLPLAVPPLPVTMSFSCGLGFNELLVEVHGQLMRPGSYIILTDLNSGGQWGHTAYYHDKVLPNAQYPMGRPAGYYYMNDTVVITTRQGLAGTRYPQMANDGFMALNLNQPLYRSKTGRTLKQMMCGR